MNIRAAAVMGVLEGGEERDLDRGEEQQRG